MIPFPSLGLDMRGKTWFKDENYRADTLVHEITHQVMDSYLPFLPKWVIEGTAEYTESLPYKNGIFRVESHKSGLKDHLDEAGNQGYAASIPSLEKHMTMTREQWDVIADQSPRGMGELYFRSWLIVYYFSHLDGVKSAGNTPLPAGSGARFIRFMDAVHEQVRALASFFADPRVKRSEGGRFSYPRDFPPPDLDPSTAPFKHLGVLLDGRSYAQIATEMREGFKTAGVKVSITP
jgi:hypothetical protein